MVVVRVLFSALLPPRPSLVTLTIPSLTRGSLPLQQFFNFFLGGHGDLWGGTTGFPLEDRLNGAILVLYDRECRGAARLISPNVLCQKRRAVRTHLRRANQAIRVPV